MRGLCVCVRGRLGTRLKAETVGMVQRFMPGPILLVTLQGFSRSNSDCSDLRRAQGPLGTWVEVETAGVMLQHLTLGCVLQLYAPREFCTLYWCARIRRPRACS